jgi:hypothetical protein
MQFPTLVMGDVGVKYEGLANVHHLIKALEQNYTVSKDWTGGIYCGTTFKLDYLHKHVDLSMPGDITAMLHKYQHPPTKRPQYAPHKWTEPAYDQHIQYAIAGRPVTELINQRWGGRVTRESKNGGLW